jgi:hypothetical protein
MYDCVQIAHLRRHCEPVRETEMKTLMPTRAAAAVAVVAVTFAVLVLSPRLLLASGPSSAPGPQGASVALPSDAAATSSAPATQGVGLPSDVQAELSSLPVGTVIVPCTPTHPVMPGVRTSHTTGWVARHPGFRYLSHGYCADNPNATPIPQAAPPIQQ